MPRPLLALVLISSVLAACPSAHTPVHTDTREVESLRTAAEAHWNALRWQRYEVASQAYERTEDRMHYLELWSTTGTERLIDASVVTVNLGEALDTPTQDGHLRQAEVMVRLEGYEETDLLLETSVIVQDWYRTATGWYVVADTDDAGQP